MDDLKGKAVLVMGGASGIGAGCARVLGKEGIKVVVADLDGARADEVAAAIREAGGMAKSVSVNATTEEGAAHAVAFTVESFGGLAGAINCVGGGNQPGATGELALEEWQRVLALNLTSALVCMKAEIAQMLKAGGGAIVNIASGAGLWGVEMMAPYSTAKHAVVGLTRSAALDYATRGIRVNAVCPGLTETPASLKYAEQGVDWSKLAPCPMNRLAKPEEMGEAALWLLSARSSFVTGHALPVDGGLAAS